jgi:hypothetical protein
MTVKLRRTAAAQKTASAAPTAPTLFWYNDDTELYDVTALSIQLDGSNRPEAPFGPAFLARLFDVPAGATIAWSWSGFGFAAGVPKIVSSDDAPCAVLMPEAGGTGVYTPGASGTLSAQIIDPVGQITDLAVTIEFIGA